MRKLTLAVVLFCLCVLAASSVAYITPKDSFDMHSYYDIYRVNEINGTTSNFTTYEDAEGSSVTDLEGLDTNTNAETECSGTTTYYDGEGNCDDISGVYVQSSDWTTIDDYPTTCNSTAFVRTIGDTLTCEEPAYIADTQADEVCSGDTTYLDGEGNCDDISGVYVQAADWTTIDDYPAACASDEAVNTIGDTSACIDTIDNATKWGDCARDGNCITSADILDVDDVDVEGDTNTYVDIAGDTMAGNLSMGANLIKFDDGSDAPTGGLLLGTDEDSYIIWDNSDGSLVLGATDVYDIGNLRVQGDYVGYGYIGTTDDIFTSGSGDDLWLGDATQADAPFKAYADGSLNISTGAFEVDTGGAVTTSGNITTTADVVLGDNDIIYFGDGKDVTMYFDGTDFIIQVA